MLDGMLRPGRTWPSPTIPKLAQSFIAWEWLAFASGIGDQNSDALVSRLAPKHHWFSRPEGHGLSYGLSLYTAKWGIIALKLHPHSEGVFMADTSNEPIIVVHLTSDRGVQVVPM